MDTRRTIRRILFTTVWIVVGGGMLTLLVAAIGKKNKEQCKNYVVTIKGGPDQSFIADKDIVGMLTKATNGKIAGRPMTSFDLHRLQAFLENNVWIKSAQLYFDNNNVLHVVITQRQPIARIFTKSDQSFYLDNTLKELPLSDNRGTNLPVFTDLPEKITTSKDSMLLSQVKDLAEFITDDSFWKSQVAQIDIDDDRNFEMIPVVGNHTVELGDGNDIEQKFHRLFVFYQDVLSKTGFDKYATINVQFDGQVVAVKGKTLTKVDSVQLRKNVEKLMLQAQQIQSDTTFTTDQQPGKPIIIDTTYETENKLNVHNSSDKPKSPVPLKSTLTSKPDAKQRKPKAVMPKRN